MKPTIATILAFIATATVCARAAETPLADTKGVALFETKIRPLLIRRCGECHSTEDPEAGLTLTTPKGIAAGGESGLAVVAGKPKQSRLIQAVRYTSRVKMPPDQRLPADEIEALEAWVLSGAHLPGVTIAVRPAQTSKFEFTDADLKWWSLQPIRDPQPPPVASSKKTLVRTPVDRFILSKLERNGLTLSEEAARVTLLRRVTFNLTGLPPTPAEVDEFLRDERPDAYERVVERLLASPACGERWGRHWLDVARYADTNGGGFDYVYPNAWHYRDYVVRAFNEDKPYDQFLMEQLAGDLLTSTDNEDENLYVERLKATGLLTLAPKGLGMQDKQQMALDVVDDQIDVLGRSLMGLTLSCARCHDHKFDPISTVDYYSLAGIFRSTVSLTDTDKNPSYWPERPLESPATNAARADHKARLAANKKATADIVSNANMRLVDDARKRLAEYLFAAARIHRGSVHAPAIAHWAFDEVTDGLVPARIGPVGQLANLNANADEPLPKLTGGSIGGALAFGGQRDAVTFTAADLSALNFGKATDFTVSFWLKAADGYSPNTADTVMAARYPSALWFVAMRPGSYNGLYFRHYDGKRTIDIKPSANQLPKLIDLQWHHIVFTSDRDGMGTVWIDGKSAGSVSIATISSAADFAKPTEFSIGSSNNQFRGSLDDVAIWDRLLTSDEITRLYKLGSDADQPLDVAGVEAKFGQQRADQQQPFTIESAKKQGFVSGVVRNLVQQLSDAKSPLRSVVAELPNSLQEAQTAIERAGPALRKLLDDPKSTPLKITGDASAFYSDETRQQLAALREARMRIEETAVSNSVPAMIAFDAAKPADMKVAIAGDHRNLGAIAARGFPKVINATAMKSREVEAVAPKQSGRLQLARWLTREDHPLTARVMVNRIWQHHFGIGLVATPDNFGRLGERPSHPELLDWLASRFIRDGWSIKRLHRVIVLSTTYRQASSSTHGNSFDSGNRLLWKMNRRRLEAEAIRDSMLAVSGSLDGRVGGTVNNAWKPKMFSVDNSNAETANYETNRRSIYLPIVRGAAVHEMLQLFDFGDPNSITPQRETTTVASQALFFLNNQFVIDQAKLLADRLLNGPHDNNTDRVRQLYRLVLSREPTQNEMKRAVSFVGETADSIRWRLLCQALFCLSEFVYVD